MLKKTLLFILYGVLFAPLLFAQSPRFSNLNLEDGLPGTSVRCLFRDKFGYIWMGVESKGLCRYDGSKFVTFSSISSDTTSLSNNFITSICEDKQGNLWIGTEAGLNLYHRNTSTFSRFSFSENNSNGLFDNKINFVKIDSQQLLWIGTDKGLNSIDLTNASSQALKRHILPHSTHPFANASNNTVNSFFEDALGNRWFGTKNGLFRYSKDLAKLMYWPAGKNTENGLTCNKIQIIIQIASRIYLGTNDGVFTFEPKENDRIKFHKLSITFPETNVSDLAVVKDQLWVATTFDGLYTFPLSTLMETHLSPEVNQVSTLKNYPLGDILLNPDSTVWLASRSKGVFIAGDLHALFQIELENKEVTSILEDRNGREWIGTKRDGVFVREPHSNLYQQVLSRQECNQVNCIVQFGEELYIGCISGLARYHPSKRTLAFFRLSKVQNLVPWKEYLIVGSKDGVHLFHPATARFEPLPLAMENDRQKLSTIITSMVGMKNSLWIGTDSKGIIEYDLVSKKVIQYTAKDKKSNGLSSNYIKTLFADRNGTLWIGTKYEGLNSFDNVSKRFLSFGERQGLSNLSVYTIAEDQQGALWVGTHEGISRLDTTHRAFENFNRINAHNQSMIITPNAVFTNIKGELFIGSQQGLILFYPKNLQNINHNQGKFILSSLKANGEYKLNAIDKDTSIELSHDENFLQFDFAYIDYLKLSSPLYYYRLKGLHEDWMETGRADFVSFSKLPAGNYVFQFGFKDRNGKIREAPFSINLNIKPYFLTSPAVCILYVLVLLAMIRLFWKYLTAKRKIKEITIQMEHFQEMAHTRHQFQNAETFVEAGQSPMPSISVFEPLDLPVPSISPAPDNDEQFLKKCYEILEKNYSTDSFNVAVFSLEIGMSRTNFYNKLKSASGFTPSSMIWEYRLLKAAHFLKDRSKSISDIALECGFENLSSFSTMFKKRFGKTPSDFKASL